MTDGAVGRSAPRRDAVGKVTGAARYPADLQPDDVLHARVVFSGRPHARMVSMDTSAARGHSWCRRGVHRGRRARQRVRADDVRSAGHGRPGRDRAFPGGGRRQPLGRRPDRHRRGRDARTPPTGPPNASTSSGRTSRSSGTSTPRLTGEVLVRPDLHPESNVYVTYRLRKGDVAAGWEQADVVVEGTLRGALPGARLPAAGGGRELHRRGRDGSPSPSPASGPTRTRSRSRTPSTCRRTRSGSIYPAIGGAFGGREDMSLQIVMALASWRLAERGEHRPIRCQWSREESIVGHHKRHRGRIPARWGATADGRVVVAEATCHLDAGRLQLHDQQGRSATSTCASPGRTRSPTWPSTAMAC